MTIKDDCLCGHDRTTHYLHTDQRRYCCTALRCECNLFEKPDTTEKRVLRAVDQEDAPYTPRTNVNKPHLDEHCRCIDCMRWHGYIV